jgi:hypothetical protein
MLIPPFNKKYCHFISLFLFSGKTAALGSGFAVLQPACGKKGANELKLDRNSLVLCV